MKPKHNSKIICPQPFLKAPFMDLKRKEKGDLNQACAIGRKRASSEVNTRTSWSAKHPCEWRESYTNGLIIGTVRRCNNQMPC